MLYEGFENVAQPNTADFVQTLDDFDDGAGMSVPGYVGVAGNVYGADPAWNGQFCNGLIVTAADPATVPAVPQSDECLQIGWDDSRDLAETLGVWAAHADYPYPVIPSGDPLENHAVTSYTQGDAPPGAMASTDVIVTPGHFYSASVDVAQANCWTDDPVVISVDLAAGAAEPVSVFGGPIAACDLPVHQLNGDNVGTFVGTAPFLATLPTVQVSVVNNLGGGDDNASPRPREPARTSTHSALGRRGTTPALVG